MECEHAVGYLQICATCYHRGKANIKTVAKDATDRIVLLALWARGEINALDIIELQKEAANVLSHE